MRTLRNPGLLALCLSVAAPAFAQSDHSTPEENLDCAVTVAAVMGNSDDPVVMSGFAAALGYFTGLYEGATGTDIEGPMVARIQEMTDADVTVLHDVCGARMAAFGARLGELGEQVAALEEAK